MLLVRSAGLVSNHPPHCSISEISKERLKVKECGHNVGSVAVLRGSSCSPVWGRVSCTAAEQRRCHDKRLVSEPLGSTAIRGPSAGHTRTAALLGPIHLSWSPPSAAIIYPGDNQGGWACALEEYRAPLQEAGGILGSELCCVN